MHSIEDPELGRPLPSRFAIAKEIAVAERDDKAQPPKRRRTMPAQKYPANLTPLPSSLRPPCLAKERLTKWTPAASRADLGGLPSDAQQRVREVVTNAWAESTRTTYGSGLLVYHVYCDANAISEQLRAPANAQLISEFASTITGQYAASTVVNYVLGLKAWHVIHGLTWFPNDAELDAIFKAAQRLAPLTSRRKQRLPYTIDFITLIQEKLDMNNPEHVAVFSCLTTTFFCAARLGEFTIKNLASFDPQLNIKPLDVRKEMDRNGLAMTVFHLPRTKTSVKGEEVSWSTQDCITDPEPAFNRHLQTNTPPPDGLLFAYKHKHKHKPLMKTHFLQVVAKAAREAGRDPLQGHGIRVGATLEYLLRGIPFDVMKMKGRWASDAFQLYLRKHAQILAPYMQATPAIHDSFVRYTMPRAC